MFKIIAYGLWICPHRESSHVLKGIASFKNSLRSLSPWCPVSPPNAISADASVHPSALLDSSSSSPTLKEKNSHMPEGQHKSKMKQKHRHKAYLNCFGNVLDLISILCYWIDLGLMLNGYRTMTIFKTLGASRPLRLLYLFSGTAMIMESLEESLSLLLVVLGFFFFFLLLWSLIGLISFQGAFSRRCYALEETGEPTIVVPPLYCSGFYNGTSVVGPYNKVQDDYGYPGRQGYLCATGQMCIEDPPNNPFDGFVNYDNIFSAFFNTFTFQTLEGWTPTMYQNQDSESNSVAIYYCLGVYIMSFLITFLLFAVVASSFMHTRASHAANGFKGKKKKYPLLRVANTSENVTQDDIAWMYGDPYNEAGLGVTRLWLKHTVTDMVKSAGFFYFGGLLVCLNLVFMCMRSFYSSDDMLEMIDNAETAFTFIFVIEIILRIVGAPNWIQFWSLGRNQVDLLLVISTCVIQLPMIQNLDIYKYLTIFQVFRLYRLLICFPRVRRIIYAALGSGESIINVVLFLVMSTALCCPIFMQMAGGDFGSVIGPNDTALRFDTFFQSFITLIMIYTSESWTALLYNAMESQPGLGSVYVGTITCVYFVFARYILGGLYIAVILENFELEEEHIRQYQIKRFIRRHRDKDVDKSEAILNKLFSSIYDKSDKRSVQVSKLPASLTAPLSRSSLTELLKDTEVPSIYCESTGTPEVQKLSKKEGRSRKKVDHRHVYTNTAFADTTADDAIDDYELADDAIDDYELIVAEENRSEQQSRLPQTKALLLFSNHSKVRYFCKRLAGNNVDGNRERKNAFNWFIMACVVLSILLVILDEPSTRVARENSIVQYVYSILDYILSAIFVIEIIIRIIADGLILPQRSYLRSSWNTLDFCVVIFNAIVVCLGPAYCPRVLNTLRSLRVLRVVRYFKGVRDIFIDLFHAFPLMLDALMLTFIVLVPYSVYGVNIFGGKFWLCNDSASQDQAGCIGEFSNNISDQENIERNILIPRVWQNPNANAYSFDTFLDAFNHLLGLTSTEGWVDSMFSAMSTPTELNQQPQFSWDSPLIYHSIFYLSFMIISHGVVQLFVGVIIEKFKQRSGITTFTLKQRQYLDLRRQMAEVKPAIKAYRPDSIIRGWCYDLVANKRGIFNQITMYIVIVNILVVCTEYKNEPYWLEQLQEYAYMACIIIYALEVFIKFLGMGYKKWIASKWNWYDGFIAFGAVFLLSMRFAIPDLWTLRVERYFLVFAAFRLGESIDVLQKIYHTVAHSMPSIIHVSAVFLIVMCLFAMLFMELFGLTRYGPNSDEIANFRTYGNALLLLVRMTTGEGWNYVMMDYVVTAPNCVASDSYLETDCGYPSWSLFLFNFFYIVCTHIFMNLFTAVIISNFEHTYERQSRFTGLTKNDLRKFRHAWADIDPSGTGYIQKKDVTKLLHHIRDQFQLGIYDDTYSIKNIIKLSKVGTENYTQEVADERLDEKSVRPGSYYAQAPMFCSYNIQQVNNCLSKIDMTELQKRRKQYNLLYREIVEAETIKGISFADVLIIITYRFINIEESLAVEPLIARLEKLERLERSYAVEKACGVFLTLIQRKRYLHQLWQKHNEDEIKKLGVASPNLYLDTSMASLRLGGSSPTKAVEKQRHSPVPRIIVENVAFSDSTPQTPVAVSPLSNFSLDTQHGTPFGGPHSPNTMSGLPSPNPDEDESPFFGSGSLNFFSHSPGSAGLSPYARHSWLMMDSHLSMSEELANRLMDNLHNNTWSGLLEEEEEANLSTS
ncbi:Ion transport protein-domain-containing protein [Spinellus fusiger]|nr:Ion transport protein-domain-containing protein [Spinellus fusiger]